MRQTPFVRATFDADGVATARLAGPPPYQRWAITNVAVSTNSSARTTASVYRNDVSPTSLVDSTPNRSGNSNSSDSRYDLSPGDSLIIQWVGGTPGAVATAAIELDVN